MNLKSGLRQNTGKHDYFDGAVWFSDPWEFSKLVLSPNLASFASALEISSKSFSFVPNSAILS